MKLSYRGITYNQQAVSFRPEVNQTTGRYRGGECKINLISSNGTKTNNLTKTYRGVTY